MEETTSKLLQRQDRSFLQEHYDFDFLKREGLKHIGQLSGKIWTDHNVHDPGITILEMLAYALLDLGYRTKLPIQDILASPTGNTNCSYFTPAQILGNNPTTILDYRKILIEIEGVCNAWLVPNLEESYYVHYPRERKGRKDKYKVSCGPKGPSNELSEQFTLNGLYTIIIQTEADYTVDQKQILREEILDRLHQYRNLCEDFVEVKFLCEEQVGLCADVEIEPNQDPEEVYVQIISAIEQFLTPKVRFYTLQEMLEDKGKAIEEIFEGRPFSSDYSSPGFIDTEELESIRLKKEIHLSDLFNIIAAVEGVKSVQNLKISGYTATGKHTNAHDKDCNEWVYHLAKDHVPVFSSDSSCINLVRDGAIFKLDPFEVQRLSNQYLRRTPGRAKGDPSFLDISIQHGQYRADLGSYYSIQNEFPRVYGIGEGGLSPDASKLRQAQALQLKGFLLFFDQLLVQFLEQLSSVHNLFSFSEAAAFVEQTANLDTVPDLEKILQSYTASNDDKVELIPIALETFTTTVKLTLEVKNPREFDFNGLRFSANSRLRRDVEIEQLVREFRQENYTINTYPSENCYYFAYQLESLPIIILGRRIYQTEEDAVIAANNISFLGTDPSNYHLINIPDELNYSFGLSFDPSVAISITEELTETTQSKLDRRNHILNHLLARFAEDFTAYSLLVYEQIKDKEQAAQSLIKTKTKFLSNYPDISANRGRAFNYRDQNNQWNTGNISGVEKRVNALTGVEDWQRKYLCNFEVHKYGLEYKVLFRYGEKTIFETKNTYDSVKKASGVCETILKEAVENTFYGKEESNNCYQIIFHSSIQLQALSFDNEKERDFCFNAIRNLFHQRAADDYVNVYPSDSVYFLELVNASEEQIALSSNTYKSKEDAEAQVANFVKQIKDQKPASTAIELSKLKLQSKQIREESILLDFAALKSYVKVADSEYHWVVNGIDEKPVLTSCLYMPSKKDAFNNYLETIFKIEKEWKITDQWAQLVSKTGRVLANHKIQTETEGELVIEQADKWLNPAQIEQRFLKDTGQSFGFEIRNAANRVLLESVVLYKSKNLVANIVEELDIDNYEIVEEEENYSILFKDTKDRVIATTRVPVKDPKALLEQIKSNREKLEIVLVADTYTFKILNAQGEEILEGFTRYSSRIRAFAALFQLVADFKEKNLDFKRIGEEDLDGLELYLVDEQGQYLAFSPKEPFRKEEYWKQEKKTITKWVKEMEFPISYLSESKFYLIDKVGNEVMRSISYYSTPNAARQAGRHSICLFAKVQDLSKTVRPHKEYNGWVFELLDEAELPMAASIIGDRLSLGEYLEAYQKEILEQEYKVIIRDKPNKWKHRFYVLNAKGGADLLYNSKKAYTSQKKAIEAYQEFKALSTNLEFESVKSSKGLSFQIKANQQILLHPGLYETEEGRAAAIAQNLELLRYFNNPDVQKESVVLTERSRDEESYVYRIIDKGNALAFHPCSCFESSDSRDLKDRLTALCERNYLYPEFCLSGGKILVKVNGRYHYVLRSSTGDFIYFCSISSYSSKLEAMEAFNQEYLILIHLASDATNYKVRTLEDGTFEYYLGTFEEQAIATMTEEVFSDRTILAPKFKAFPIRLKATRLGEKCFEDEIDCYYFHLLGDNNDCELNWLSTCCYETPEEVWADFRHFLYLLNNKVNYRSQLKAYVKDWRNDYIENPELLRQQNPCCYYITITEVLAESCVEYINEASAWGREEVVATNPDFAFVTLEEACKFIEKYLSGLNNASAEIATVEKVSALEGRRYFYTATIRNEDSEEDNITAVSNFVGEALFEAEKAAIEEAERSFKFTSRSSRLKEFQEGLRIIQDEDCLYRIALVKPNAEKEKLPLASKRPKNPIKAQFESCIGLQRGLEASCTREAFLPYVKEGKNGGYSFKIIDPANYYMAHHPYRYHTIKDRDKMQNWLFNQLQSGNWTIQQEAIDEETVALKLCIVLNRETEKEALIYNVNSTQPFNLNWTVSDDGEGVQFCLFNIPGLHSKKDLKEILDCYQKNFSLLFQNKDFFAPVGDVTDHTFGIAIINPNAILALHPQCYEFQKEVMAAIERTWSRIHTEGMHLLEHILLRPEKIEQDEETRFDCKCTLLASPNFDCRLPIPEDDLDPCAEEGRQSIEYIPGLDPYSFWASTVLPSWSSRYKDLNFRNFVSNTLYRETPAHVALNLLWLDPQQLCKFEDQYREWLNHKAGLTVCKGEMPCDLINCLLQLKNYCPKPTPGDESCDCEELSLRQDFRTAAINSLVGNSRNYASPLLSANLSYLPVAGNRLVLEEERLSSILANTIARPDFETVLEPAALVEESTTLTENAEISVEETVESEVLDVASPALDRPFLAAIEAVDLEKVLESKTYGYNLELAKKITDSDVTTELMTELEDTVVPKSLTYAKRGEGTGRDVVILEAMTNTMALTLDKLVETNKEEVQFEAQWKAIAERLKEKDFPIEKLLEVWKPEILKAKAKAPVIDKYLELLKG